MALTAFDDGELAATAVPPLTTVRQDIYGMGVAAAELLLERMKDPSRPPESRRLPTTLIVRESTAGRQGRVSAESPQPARTQQVEQP
ncbi:MAG: substrate-binding domain-containing protein [Vicinamibacterales bacterium]|jgi:LacI family transcriptional regulator|nr:substrate-binding domain-containing protein [Vicinamibacterales bacterium]